eukprot:CAMPEP_0206494114 /NCGR_PEP_ID=MMETSP0324_2-20121206/47501_1 /ASSEMBLY_ACC=CAM_ASM_000836 /TAXON_ID=2866 /ORGANISM="Crypthecodinium cohnii, Strain Seligo" /LENGTH=31 /DNA_ID= /DNA_START= /DNA_END= /DNA_ORIENTATION=
MNLKDRPEKWMFSLPGAWLSGQDLDDGLAGD